MIKNFIKYRCEKNPDFHIRYAKRKFKRYNWIYSKYPGTRLLSSGYDKPEKFKTLSSWFSHVVNLPGPDMTNDRRIFIRKVGFWKEYYVPESYDTLPPFLQ